MFRSVIERQRAGRLGAGAWVSLGVHAALFAVVLLVSSKPSEPPPEEPPYEKLRIIVPMAGPSVPMGSPATALQRQATAQRPRRDRVPRRVRPLPVEPPPPVEPAPVPSTPTEAPKAPGESGPVGVSEGGPHSPPGGGPPVDFSGDGMSSGSLFDTLPFGEGMTPPVPLSGQPIVYTPQARAARVEGTLIARCVITVEGRVRECRILKGLPHMDEAVLDALYSRRYRPVTFQGRPVSVSYTVTLNLRLPR